MADIIKEALEAFAECEEAEEEQRASELDDLRFARLGEQWPEQVRKQREIDGRPCLTINKMPSFIRQVVNDARQNKPQIKVHPIDDGGDRKTAEIIGGLIKNIETVSGADIAYDTGLESAVTTGRGYWRVVMDYAYDDTFDMDLLIKRIANPFTVYGDPMSQEADGCDWNVAFVTEMQKKSAYLRKYPKSEIKDWSFDGKDEKALSWVTDDAVRTAEYWKRDEVDAKILLLSNGSTVSEEQFIENKDLFESAGITVINERSTKSYKVSQYILNGVEVLEENQWPGKYIPIIPVYGEEINVEGKKIYKSLIRDAKDAQRMANYWETTSTEMVALAPRVPYIGPKGAFVTDADKWATANSSNHAFIQYDGQISPQRQPLDSGPAAGAFQEALKASDNMKAIMGMFDASLGARSNETSGKAIMARQREGDVATFHFIDNRNRSMRHTGRILVDLIPHVYNKARIIRVLGEDKPPEAVKINQPVPETDDNGQPVVDEQGEAITRVFDLTTGKYDVTVTSGPSFTTRRQEAAEQMTELLRSFPAAAPVLGDIIARNLDWPGADEIEKRLKKMQESQGQPDPKIQQQMELEKMKLQSDAQSRQQKMELDKQESAQKMNLKRQEMMFDMALKEEQMKFESKLKMTEMATAQIANGKSVEESQNEKQQEMQLKSTEMQQRQEMGVAVLQALQSIATILQQPTRIIKDAQGNIIGSTRAN